VALLADALGVDPQALASQLAEVEVHGYVEKLPRGVRLSDAGRAALDTGLGAERAGLDRAALEAVYERFDAINAEFKHLITDWQLRAIDGDVKINDHSDPEYDRAVLDRLLDLHGRFAPLVRDVAGEVPRLASYERRFASARTRIANGEARYVAAPLIDSYHTIWFELHEELLQLTGRSRAAEAAAGRAD
jgi:pyruvate,orthophosphate dikinase